MISAIKFSCLSLLPGQIVWSLMDWTGLSYRLKSFLRRNLLREVNGGEKCLRFLPLDYYEEYTHVFRRNKYDGFNEWSFNGRKIRIDDEFIFSEMNKSDYTYRMVFFHFEWLFGCKIEDPRIFSELSDKFRSSPIFYHPSCVSQRSFVLGWMISKYPDSKILRSIASEYLRLLIVKTEDSVGANHRVDNYLAIILLSHLNGYDEVALWASRKLISLCRKWVYRGYFPEKTPCYQALISRRLNIVISAISKNDFILENVPDALSFLEEMLNVLMNFPDVHVNDSYLPLSCWKRGEVRYCKYAWSCALDGGVVVVIVGDALPDRGFRGHAHDSTGALFVHSPDGRQIIGGYGTETYRVSENRNFSRSIRAYCAPFPEEGFVPRLVPWKSFRHTSIRRVEVNISHRSDGPVVIDIVDNKSNNYKSSWVVDRSGKGKINLICSRPSVLNFWSDFNPEALAEKVHISGEGLILKCDEGYRYDGIGNRVESFCYEIRVKDKATFIFL